MDNICKLCTFFAWRDERRAANFHLTVHNVVGLLKSEKKRIMYVCLTFFPHFEKRCVGLWLTSQWPYNLFENGYDGSMALIGKKGQTLSS